MRILWLGKAAAKGDAGDEVFDRKTIAALRAKGHDVTTLHPSRVSKWREAANLLRGVPHYRARFASSANRRMLRQSGSDFDLTICSWEPLDTFVPILPHPAILIAHNITSLALPALFPGRRWAWLAAYGAAAWEHRVYQRRYLVALATLSRHDQAYVDALPGAPPSLLTIPGMPPIIPLADDARLRQELVLLGTYDWIPKRRDVNRFMQEYASMTEQAPLFASPLPAGVTCGPLVNPPLPDQAAGDAIRFGVITDRFIAGHKLKTLAYIAQNQIVLSFADVQADFVQIPDHDLFLRSLDSAAAIPRHMAEIAALDPVMLRGRFLAFQRRCAECFTWDAVAARLLEAANGPARTGWRDPAVHATGAKRHFFGRPLAETPLSR